MIWHLLAFAAGVQLGLAVTLWRLGEQRQALQDWSDQLDERAAELDRLWNIVISERRGECGQ
jgi:hypothetical protein